MFLAVEKTPEDGLETPRMKRITVVVAVLLLLGFVGWRIWQKLAGEREAAQPRQARGATVAVVVEPVRRQTIRDVRAFTGTIEPKTQFVVAPKVAGRLEKLEVNIGDEIKSGDPIALLDSQEYGQQLEQARAELDVARANVMDSQSTLDTAARDLERVKELRKQKVASEAEMDQAEAQYRAAQAKHEVALAQVKQKEAALKASEVRLSYTRIVASWDSGAGTRVIGERFVDEGAMLGANQPIVSILDIDTVIAAIFVIERDYPYVRTGQSVTITTDAFPGRDFAGTVARKAPLLKESSRQARVEVEVANADRLLAPGMFVRAEIQFAAHDNAVVVPMAAVVRREGRSGVFLADPTALKARFVPVTVGIAAGETAEILDPPLDGQVVTLGQHLLEDGSAIVLPDAKPADSGREVIEQP